MTSRLKAYKLIAQRAEDLLVALTYGQKAKDKVTVACIELERALDALPGRKK